MDRLSSKNRPGLRIEWLEVRAVPATLIVDDDLGQFRNADYTSIQAAVDAASAGDTILVARGTYIEQVIVPEDKDDLTIRSQAPRQAVIQATDTLTGANAIVTVDGADGVTLRGFTITGPAVTANSLTAGVAIVDGGSATIRDNVITGIRNDPLDGVQTGIGIIVDGFDAETTAVIQNNTITDYQKGGIVVFGDEASATVTGNTVVGAGPTDLIAQNGIQVSDGADAVVSDNRVSGNVYTGADVVATGIYVDTAGDVSVIDNRVFENQNGMLILNQDFILVAGNRVTDNTRDGIDIGSVNGGLLIDNRVEDNGLDGVVLSDVTNLGMNGNRIRNNAGYGLAITGESSENIIFGNILRGNIEFDAYDDTTGSGTGGTANFWFSNRIGTKNNPDLR